MPLNELITIPAGSFWVGARSAVQLEAFLGTCVAVAAYDAEAHVGGLIHLLLPEPPLPGSAYQREKYATTGLPLFLAALRDRGGEPGRMKACLAGGALIGPIAAQDLDLDIGGRTCEKAVDFLTREDIQIVQFESGGFMPTQIGLDMHSGNFSITPTGDASMTVSSPLSPPSEDDIQRAMQGLQPIPQVALRILRMVSEEDYRIHDLARMVRQDQVICARTLKLCNAASFARRGRIESLEQALVFLGQDRFTRSVIAVCVQDFFSQQGNGYSLRIGGMYQHAVGTAMVAEQLARRTHRLIPALAYTGGLLHDIGKVVLDQFVAPRQPLFYRDLAAETNFLAAEKRHLGMDHTEAGRRLALNWGLPAPFVDVITHHHYPEKARSHRDLVHIVYIADLIMSRFHSGLELEKINTEHLADRFASVGLAPADLQAIIDGLPTSVFSMSMAIPADD
ncbi:MAG: HDOD domain-containing protein [Desulfosarcina sp.]|nr:HDOD domain-containing protein [Desulfobacterales bacterium]